MTGSRGLEATGCPRIVGVIWNNCRLMAQPDVAVSLRTLLYQPLVSGTHSEITDRFRSLGLVEGDHAQGTKAERVTSVLEALPNDELARVARWLLTADGMWAELRNQIQDVLWVGQGPVIWERTRRNLAAALDIEDLVVDADRFEAMLERWWVLGTPNPFEGIFDEGDRSTLAQVFGPASSPERLRKEIDRHVFRNSDWSAERLFDELGAFDAVDRRFAGFLEDLVSHQVVIHEDAQRRIVDAVAPHLREARLEFREVDLDGGYPVFRLVATGQSTSRPKSLIFGSTRKPDLRISDTVDNEIEIVDAADVLVFDDPIGPSGLRWRDLQAWWSRHHPEQDDDAARRALYARMLGCLPKDSPPQRRLFQLYHQIHGSRIPDLPALLPEVWLHWDHKTVRERGVRALLGQRMDFLMLTPNHHRIVLEVDGDSHYTDEVGNPSPAAYARNTALDRAMRLRGYEVFRFGGAELHSDAQAKSTLAPFFSELFGRYDIKD
jgi:AbiJ N-terminal domain 3